MYVDNKYIFDKMEIYCRKKNLEKEFLPRYIVQ